MTDDPWTPPSVLLAVDLVILTLHDGQLRLLLVKRGIAPHRGSFALPGGFLQNDEEELVSAARRELLEETGLDVDAIHLEPLGVYGTPGRDPRGRVVSVAYLVIAPRLPQPVAGTDADGAGWHSADSVLAPGFELAFDHRTIVQDGIERARSKLEYTNLAVAFCPPCFTISELQEVYEAVWGVRLDPRNFYRKVQKTHGFIVADGMLRKSEVGRPARLFRAGTRRVLQPPMVRSGDPADDTPGVS